MPHGVVAISSKTAMKKAIQDEKEMGKGKEEWCRF